MGSSLCYAGERGGARGGGTATEFVVSLWGTRFGPRAEPAWETDALAVAGSGGLFTLGKRYLAMTSQIPKI